MAKMTAHRATAYVFSALAALSMGFITMTSFMIVFPGVGLAWGIGVFFAGCLVEADVYLPGVTGSFKNLFFKWGLKGLFSSIEHALKKQIIREFFKEAALQSKLIAFMTRLEANKEFLKNLGFSDTEIETLKKLKATQFVEFFSAIYSKKKLETLDISSMNADDQSLFVDLLGLNAQLSNSEFQKKYRRRKWLAVAALIAALGTGLAFGAITFTHVLSAIIAIAGLGALAASSPVWLFAAAGVLASFAAVAYFMMMYHTLVSAIQGSFFKKMSEKIKEIFVPKDPLDTWQKRLFFGLNSFFKALALAAIVGLCVLVTMATADAWFNSSERFFALLGSGAFEAVPLYATVISYALVWALYLPITALFSIKNSGDSIEGFGEAFKSMPARCRNFFTSLKLRWQNESFLQFVNPFRLIAAFLDSILATTILGSHVVVSGFLPGEGATEGGFMSKVLPEIPATVAGSVVELTVDADSVLGGEHGGHDHAHADHHEHDHKNNLNKGMVAGHDHDHHNGLTSYIVAAVAFAPKYLGFIWDSAARGTWFLSEKYSDYVSRRPDQYQVLPSDVAHPSVASSSAAVGKTCHSHGGYVHVHDDEPENLPSDGVAFAGASS